MRKLIEKLNNWCLKYQGIWLFLAAIGLFIVPAAGIDARSMQDGINGMVKILLYHFPISVYQLVLLMVLSWFFIYRLRKKYKVQSISQKILVGVWKNSWGPPQAGHETLEITRDMKYYIGTEHYFNIVDFKFDPQTNYIEFRKVGVRPDDNRDVFNKVHIVNNDTLEGTELDYPIKYTRISALK